MIGASILTVLGGAALWLEMALLGDPGWFSAVLCFPLFIGLQLLLTFPSVRSTGGVALPPVFGFLVLMACQFYGWALILAGFGRIVRLWGEIRSKRSANHSS